MADVLLFVCALSDNLTAFFTMEHHLILWFLLIIHINLY